MAESELKSLQRHFGLQMKIISWLTKNKTLSISITVLIAISIFLISSIPGTQVSGAAKISWLPFAYHFLAFFFFNFFLLISINNIKIKYLLSTIILSIIYAFLDEFHQLFVPMRSFSLNDILIDVAGILLSTIIYIWIRKSKNSSQI